MNVVKDMLKAGKAAVGTSASLNSPVEFLADAGFDFLLFDTQHSPVAIKELQHQVRVMKGKKAIDKELERLTPLLKQGGYIPMVDHHVPPEVSLSDYRYYLKKKRELIGKTD